MFKLLDKYFAKKVIEKIEEKYTCLYLMDKKIKKRKNKYTLYIKKIDQKEEYYKELMDVAFNDWLETYTTFVLNDKREFRDYVSFILEKKRE